LGGGGQEKTCFRGGETWRRLSAELCFGNMFIEMVDFEQL
jgi:hypothetical protein